MKLVAYAQVTLTCDCGASRSFACALHPGLESGEELPTEVSCDACGRGYVVVQSGPYFLRTAEETDRLHHEALARIRAKYATHVDTSQSDAGSGVSA